MVDGRSLSTPNAVTLTLKAGGGTAGAMDLGHHDCMVMLESKASAFFHLGMRWHELLQHGEPFGIAIFGKHSRNPALQEH